MSEEPTQNLPDGGSFEEKVFARLDSVFVRLDSIDTRLDSMDTRLDSMDARLQSVETQAERRALETKPIWERALAETLELRRSLENVERKIDVLSRARSASPRRPVAR